VAEERHVVFRVAGERFALPLGAVREVVVPQPPFARVPRAGGAVRGVMNLRGRVVAVVDLAELMGLPPRALAAGYGQVVILERDRRRAARGGRRGRGTSPPGNIDSLSAPPRRC
jgi:purine-binding chemotaxis protein CheW